MPSDTVLLALIVAASTTITGGLPVILNVMNNRALARKEERDYARQDVVAKRAEEAVVRANEAAHAARAVADQAAEAARLLVQSQQAAADKAAEVARLLVESNAKTAEAAAAIGATLERKVDIIHTLVNSQLTSAVQASFDATKTVLILLLKVIDLDREAGRQPSVEALAEVEATRGRIAELQATVSDRLKQSSAAERAAG